VQLVATGRTHKIRGGNDDGQFSVTLAQDFSDAGQAALLAAVAGNQNTLPFKGILVGADANYDTIYFGAKVMGVRTQLGGANSVLSATVTMEINTPIYQGAN
jgi:hypothetical protein